MAGTNASFEALQSWGHVGNALEVHLAERWARAHSYSLRYSVSWAVRPSSIGTADWGRATVFDRGSRRCRGPMRSDLAGDGPDLCAQIAGDIGGHGLLRWPYIATHHGIPRFATFKKAGAMSLFPEACVFTETGTMSGWSGTDSISVACTGPKACQVAVVCMSLTPCRRSKRRVRPPAPLSFRPWYCVTPSSAASCRISGIAFALQMTPCRTKTNRRRRTEALCAQAS